MQSVWKADNDICWKANNNQSRECYTLKKLYWYFENLHKFGCADFSN